MRRTKPPQRTLASREDTTAVIVLFPKPLHRALKVHAAEHGVALAQLIRDAAQEHLDRHGKGAAR